MKLPAKIQYAAKALMELGARSASKSPVTLDSIAAAQSIPRDFLVQLLHKLNHAGLTKSVRGTQGGYLLARPPSKITLLDVVNAMDKQIAAENDVFSGSPYDEAIASAWSVFNRGITASLSVSIEELLSSAERPALDYQI